MSSIPHKLLRKPLQSSEMDVNMHIRLNQCLMKSNWCSLYLAATAMISPVYIMTAGSISYQICCNRPINTFQQPHTDNHCLPSNRLFTHTTGCDIFLSTCHFLKSLLCVCIFQV